MSTHGAGQMRRISSETKRIRVEMCQILEGRKTTSYLLIVHEYALAPNFAKIFTVLTVLASRSVKKYLSVVFNQFYFHLKCESSVLYCMTPRRVSCETKRSSHNVRQYHSGRMPVMCLL